MGNQRAMCERKHCSFRHDMDKAWEKFTIKSVSEFFMQQSERKTIEGPEVPEVRARVVECRDGLARITLEELAPIHSVKSGTLQNACFTRPRVVADLGKSVHSHIVRLTHSRRNGPNRIMTKALWLYWKKGDCWHERGSVTDRISRSIRET